MCPLPIKYLTCPLLQAGSWSERCVTHHARHTHVDSICNLRLESVLPHLQHRIASRTTTTTAKTACNPLRYLIVTYVIQELNRRSDLSSKTGWVSAAAAAIRQLAASSVILSSPDLPHRSYSPPALWLPLALTLILITCPTPSYSQSCHPDSHAANSS